jgi:integrase
MGSVRKRQLHGTWEARWYGTDGKQHSRNFKTKGDATRHVQAQEGAKVRGDYMDPKMARTPFAAVAEEWYATTADQREKTRVGYRSILDYHLLPAFGAVAIAQIDAGTVDVYLAGIQAAPGTRLNVLRVLGAVMRHAVKRRFIPRNPVADAKRPRVPRPNAETMPFLTAKQVQELADEVGDRHRTMVLFAVYTGMRAGEIAGLCVRNLDLMRGTAKVEQAVSDVNGRLVLERPKTDSSIRTVTLPRFLVDALMEQVAGKGPNEFVFGGERPLRYGNWYARTFRPAVERLVARGDWPERFDDDERPLRFHDLRHTAAALMIANGEHPKAVQHRLGHSSIAITMDRYGKLYPDAEEALAARLDAMYQEAMASSAEGRSVASPE